MCGLALVLGAAGPSRAAPPPKDDAFAACRARFEARPDDYASSSCFFEVAQREKRADEAARLLDALQEAHPRNGWLTLARGNLEWARDPGRAEGFYRTAAAGFAEQKLAEGEVLARQNLRTMLYRRGRLEEAGAEVDLALRAAEASGQKLVLARALALQALHLTDTGRDIRGAYDSLRRAEGAAFPDGPYTLRRSIVFALGNACFQLGRFDEALEHYRRVESLTAEAGDGLTRASARYNVVNTRLRQLEERPRPGGAEEIAAEARSALATAEEADNREIQVLLHRTLGEVLGGGGGDRARSRGHYERCVALARSIRQPRELSHCLWSMARGLAEDGRAAEARQAIEEALALAGSTGHVFTLAHASRQNMRVSWAIRPREEAVRDALQSLDAIEAVRQLQEAEGGAAEVFSAWVGDYEWLAGRLLQDGAPGGSRADLERAFAVVERMRARALLDALREAKAVGDVPPDPAHAAARKALLQRIVDVHRQLLAPAVSEAERRERLAQLDALERDERATRRSPRSAGERGSAASPPRFAELAEIESALRPGEALLSYQVGLDRDALGDPSGGAFVTVSTREGTVAHRIPDRVRLQEMVPVYLGLFAGGEGRDAAAAARLFRDLVGPALAALPSGTERLVIVPDDILHHLPFTALRAAADQPALGERFAVSLVPSATLWLRWRNAPRGGASQPVLVLADPTVPAGVASDPGEPRGPLPHARREGGRVSRRLGGGALWVGDAASEPRLKAASLSDFALLHFAAHARVDDGHPDRSALLLAPGGPGEDGLLQGREIVELPLEGKVVVLAACRTAGGSVLQGEGALSLARAFFQAGAHAVVGTLWAIRDDHAGWLLDSFYRQVADGASLGAALRGARREAIGAGLPAEAWAALVVVGDGDLVAFPGGAPRAGRAWWWVLGVLGVLAALAFAPRSSPA